MSGTQAEAKPEGKDQPWWNGMTEEDIVARCPGASMEYKEGEMIVTGRPWTSNCGILCDTKDGETGDQPKDATSDDQKGTS